MIAAGALSIFMAWAAFPPQDPRGEFRASFEEELELGNPAGQDRALRRHKEAAILVFVEEGVWGFGSPVSADILRAFVDSWSRVYRKNFPGIYLNWKASLSQGEIQDWEPLSTAYGDLTRLHAGAATSRKAADWKRAAEAARLLTEGFRELGDLYYLAGVHQILGDALHPDFAGEEGDPQKALDAYQGFLDARTELQLTNDQAWADVSHRFKGLEITLGLVEIPGSAAVKPAILPAENSEWVDISLAFKLPKRKPNLRQPNDDGDEFRMGWSYLGIPPVNPDKVLALTEKDRADLGWSVLEQGVVALRIKDPTGWDLPNIYSMETPLLLARETVDRFHLRSGNYRSETFRISTNPVTVLFDREIPGGGSAEVGYEIAAGDKDDMLNGQVLPGQVTEDFGIIYLRPVTRREGKGPFGAFVFTDGNSDGLLGHTSPSLVGAIGMPKETWFYRFDTLILGKSKAAVPFSRWVSDPKGVWYEIKVPDPQKGVMVQVREASPKLGTVEVALKGLKGIRLQSCILKAEDSNLPGLLVDLMAGKKNKVEVPVGRYSFLQGICRGKDDAEALIVPPQSIPILVYVEEGETVKMEIGAPFRVVCDGVREGNTLTLAGDTLRVEGRGGERYVRLIGEPLTSRLEIEGKGFRGRDWPEPTGEEVGQDWRFAHLPGDALFALSSADAEISWRVRLRKHPWFGDADSGWVE